MKNLFLLVCTFIACSSIAQKSSLLTYTDTVNKFSFTYPNNWSIRIADTSEKAKVFVRSPKEGDNDSFTENLNVMTRKLGIEKVPATDLQKTLKATFEKNLKNFKSIEEKIVKTNGVEAYFISYTTTKLIDGMENTIYLAQQIFTKNFYLYTLTYTSAKAPPNNFYYNALKIINSFKSIN